MFCDIIVKSWVVLIVNCVITNKLYKNVVYLIGLSCLKQKSPYKNTMQGNIPFITSDHS